MRVQSANRRGFLKLMRALPALPLAAKEAATKMGLEGVFGGVIGAGGIGPAAGYGYASPDGESWARRALKRFWQPSAQRQRIAQVHWEARRLDPDLASMKSLSVSAAYAIQKGRTLRYVESRDHQNLLDQVADEASHQVGLS